LSNGDGNFVLSLFSEVSGLSISMTGLDRGFSVGKCRVHGWGFWLLGPAASIKARLGDTREHGTA
jgi:hypothetical protein